MSVPHVCAAFVQTALPEPLCTVCTRRRAWQVHLSHAELNFTSRTCQFASRKGTCDRIL